MFNVLLVDDEEMSIVALQCMLPWKDYGFTEIYSTTSSHEALKILMQQRIDACFVDINMPEMSGLELVEAAQQNNVDTKFVVVSGYSEFSYAKRAIACGVFDYCLKPIIVDDFLPVLDRLEKNAIETKRRQDTALFSQVLSIDSVCEKFISGLREMDPECMVLTVMLIRDNDLLQGLRRIYDIGYAKVCLLDVNEALIFWTNELYAERALESIKTNVEHMFVIYGTAKCDVPSVQRICKRCLAVFQTKKDVTNEIKKVSDVNEKTEILLEKVISYIDGNYEKNISLQGIASEFGINYSYLSHLFKKVLGLSFAEHLINIRLAKACGLLSDTYMKISDVAAEVGIIDYHYFCKVFKKKYGMTPSQYRSVSKGGK